MSTLNEHLLGACWGLPKASSRHLNGVFKTPKRHGEPDGRHRARTVYVGHKSGQEIPSDTQGCPAGCGILGATPLVRIGDRGKHSKTL
ncbi:UNVERIFIED_CONTAM: hypothetical protein Sradi_4120500 [Sesamum radiatum]|uniref:Uncharacterized protein n=1 Tax=Sesamum radiatum TaxID=300843 RepID=A0AAW2P2Y4_SESRA